MQARGGGGEGKRVEVACVVAWLLARLVLSVPSDRRWDLRARVIGRW